jgi:hypothetical protein
MDLNQNKTKIFVTYQMYFISILYIDRWYLSFIRPNTSREYKSADKNSQSYDDKKKREKLHIGCIYFFFSFLVDIRIIWQKKRKKIYSDRVAAGRLFVWNKNRFRLNIQIKTKCLIDKMIQSFSNRKKKKKKKKKTTSCVPFFALSNLFLPTSFLSSNHHAI